MTTRRLLARLCERNWVVNIGLDLNLEEFDTSEHPFEEVRDKAIAILLAKAGEIDEKLPDYAESYLEVVEGLRNSADEEEFDYWMHELYDLGDNAGIFVGGNFQLESERSRQIAIGTEVEKEHFRGGKPVDTTPRKVAQTHVGENPRYYPTKPKPKGAKERLIWTK